MAKTKKKSRGRLKLLLILLLILAAMLIDSNSRIVTEEYSVSAPQAGGFSGFRIVQLSDLHGKEFGKYNIRLLIAVKEATPDIIAVTGDIIDDRADLDYISSLMPALCEIAPVYYVTGNHEWATGAAGDIFAIMDECDVKTLRNDYTVLERGESKLILAGGDDPNGPYDMTTTAQLKEKIDAEQGESVFTVMLYHRNNRIETLSREGYDVVLSGHAHGGVIRLPFTDGLIDAGMNFFPTNTSGLYIRGDTQLVVSRGLGNSGPVPRFLNNPHIAVTVIN